jgi:hypothetical protein
MDLDHECIEEFQTQLKKGKIQKGYKSLLEYLLYLQSYLRKRYEDYDFTGTFYHGYLDMSYFAFITPALKEHRLKVAIVFNYKTFQFELWLSGYNKDIQKKYWEYLKKKNIKGYFLPETIKGYDSIVEDHIEEDSLDVIATTALIEERIKRFIKTIEENL